MKLGLIAGNGRFPFLLLDAARAQGFAVTVAAIREETDPEINRSRSEPMSGSRSTGFPSGNYRG